MVEYSPEEREQPAPTLSELQMLTDNQSKESRSALMGRVRQRNTKPEILVRSALHRMGYRFRLHRRDLPGSPDIVLPKYRTVVFVHGCFWHRHAGCKRTTTPKQNSAFWEAKFTRNQIRDVQATQALSDLGWNVAILWECEAEKGEEELQLRLGRLLDRTSIEDIEGNSSRKATLFR